MIEGECWIVSGWDMVEAKQDSCLLLFLVGIILRDLRRPEMGGSSDNGNTSSEEPLVFLSRLGTFRHFSACEAGSFLIKIWDFADLRRKRCETTNGEKRWVDLTMAIFHRNSL